MSGSEREERSNRIIEGIGNEVILLGTGLSIFCGTIIYFVTKRLVSSYFLCFKLCMLVEGPSISI